MAIVMSASKLTELLRTVDEHRNMYVRILNPNELALGIDPDRPTLILDLSKEKISPYNVSKTIRADTLSITTKLPRRSGEYWFEIKGHRVKCPSLKEVLCGALRALEGAAPGTIEKLSNVKARSRRIVSRDPHNLFDKEHLTEKFSEQLIPGWWYGTNNSADQTEVWLKRACILSGLRWGTDFKTNSTGIGNL